MPCHAIGIFLSIIWCLFLTAFARDALDSCELEKARANELENQLKTSQNEATMAQEECKEMQVKSWCSLFLHSLFTKIVSVVLSYHNGKGDSLLST